MNKPKIFLTFFSMFILAQGLHALSHQEADYYWQMLNLIRRQKFDFILPKAMRKNKVDMWIQVMRGGNPDPLKLDLGVEVEGGTAYCIFTDRGRDRIERAVLGGEGRSDIYDISGPAEDLGKFVAERDPKRIAVNFSKRYAFADGISHTEYLKLVKALGQKYEKRLVSAEDVITDFRTRRVISEIVFFGLLGKVTTEIEEEALSQVKPGITTLKDLAVWLRNESLAHGFEPTFHVPEVFVRNSDGDEYGGEDDYVIKGGDLVHVCANVDVMNYGTDIKRDAYVLRKGETSPPPEIRKVFDEAMRVREILCRNMKVGRTAGETLNIFKRKLEKAGFIYMNSEEFDKNADPEKAQIFVDCHPVGNTSNGNDALGPHMAFYALDRAPLEIPPNYIVSLEYMVHMPVPKWGKGKYVYLQYEENVIVTEHGVEFLYPPMEEIRLIRQ